MGDPVDEGFTMPAEWAPHARCWMAWPCHPKTFPDLAAARDAYAAVARAICRFEPLTMIANRDDAEHARKRCGDGIEVLALEIDDDYESSLEHATAHLSLRYAMDFRSAAQRYAALGPASAVAETIEGFRRAGVRHLVLDMTGPIADRDAQLQRFAEEVRPLL